MASLSWVKSNIRLAGVAEVGYEAPRLGKCELDFEPSARVLDGYWTTRGLLATHNVQTEKIENLEKQFAKLELKFEENNNIFEKKLEQIVQRFTTELNTVVAQINLSFSSLMNTMESTLKKFASNITIPKDDDYLINRKLNEKAKRFKKISEQRGNTLESVVEKKKET
ncbi:hypothetical protein TNCV_709181 [Trichonephila clavipes]|nr:hypothetical protein TNCV_709181 [Trichonephila clavipes]